MSKVSLSNKHFIIYILFSIGILFLSFLITKHSTREYEDHDIIYSYWNDDGQLEISASNYTKEFAFLRVKIPNEFFDNEYGIININEEHWVKHGDYYYYEKIIKKNDRTNSIVATFKFKDDVDEGRYIFYKFDLDDFDNSIEFIDIKEFENVWDIVSKPDHVSVISGNDINRIFKEISGYKYEYNYGDKQSNVKNIIITKEAVDSNNCRNISEEYIPVNVCYIDGTIYITTEANIIELNENSSFLFEDFDSLDSITGIERLDTSNVRNMSYMFSGSILNNIDLSTFDTSNVNNMSGMFSGSKLRNINLSKFDTSKVLNMNNMFSSAEIDKLDLSSFNTELCSSFESMFYRTTISKIDISNFSLKNVTKDGLRNMFGFNDNLQYLDISSFDKSLFTDKITGEIDTETFEQTFRIINHSPTIIVKDEVIKSLFINVLKNIKEENIKVKV